MVGVDQMPAPEGPICCFPAAFLRTGFGVSAIVNVCQSFLPVAASSATTLPRNVQHSKFGSGPSASSNEENAW